MVNSSNFQKMVWQEIEKYHMGKQKHTKTSQLQLENLMLIEQ